MNLQFLCVKNFSPNCWAESVVVVMEPLLTQNQLRLVTSGTVQKIAETLWTSLTVIPPSFHPRCVSLLHSLLALSPNRWRMLWPAVGPSHLSLCSRGLPSCGTWAGICLAPGIHCGPMHAQDGGWPEGSQHEVVGAVPGQGWHWEDAGAPPTLSSQWKGVWSMPASGRPSHHQLPQQVRHPGCRYNVLIYAFLFIFS